VVLISKQKHLLNAYDNVGSVHFGGRGTGHAGRESFPARDISIKHWYTAESAGENVVKFPTSKNWVDDPEFGVSSQQGQHITEIRSLGRGQRYVD